MDNTEVDINELSTENNNEELGKKIRLGNVTHEMRPLNEEEPEAKAKEPPAPQRLYIQGMDFQQIKDILESDNGYNCYLQNSFNENAERGEHGQGIASATVDYNTPFLAEYLYPLRRVSHAPNAKPINLTAETQSPTRDPKNVNGKTQRLRKRRVEKDKANVINVTDMPGYMGDLDLDEIVVRIEGAASSNQKKPKNKKNNKDINSNIENLPKPQGEDRELADLEEIDVEVTLDSEGIEVGDSSEQMEPFEKERTKTVKKRLKRKNRSESNSLDVVSTSSEEYLIADKNSIREAKTRISASSDGASDTSGVEKSPSESAISPPPQVSPFDSIHAAKLRAQTRLLQNCWRKFMKEFGE